MTDGRTGFVPSRSGTPRGVPAPPDRPVHVRLVADPGLPARRATAARARLQDSLEDLLGAVRLDLDVATVRLRADSTLDLAAVTASVEDDPADAVLVLTEIPRIDLGRPLVAELMPDEDLAVVSCPTLGVLAPRRRLATVLTACTARLTSRGGVAAAHPTPGWSRWGRSAEGHDVLRAHTMVGGPRTVLGMVLSNDPLRTAPRLSSALAAAAAVGAFGIFYTSIWQMATYLSTARLLLIGLLAVASMVLWLVVSNRLWDLPRRGTVARAVLLYNASTVVTLAICVLALYLALVVGILVSAAVVIAPAFMASVIGEQPDVGSYLDIAWLSAAMGVVAGGLGSSFDDETDLRRLTHGQRERQRLPDPDDER